jgi:hypothetical protein
LVVTREGETLSVHVEHDGILPSTADLTPWAPGGVVRTTDAIGLTLCRLVAERHGGTLAFSGREGAVRLTLTLTDRGGA